MAQSRMKAAADILNRCPHLQQKDDHDVGMFETQWGKFYTYTCIFLLDSYSYPMPRDNMHLPCLVMHEFCFVLFLFVI